MARMVLSDALIRAIVPPLKGQIDIWDAKLPAFGVRVSPGGTKTFILNQDKARRSIGKFGVIGLSEARTEARRQLAERTLGKVRPQSVTFPVAVKMFLDEKRDRRKARTVKDYDRHLNLLGFKCQLSELTYADLDRKLKKLPPGEFNHRLVAAKIFFNWAQRKRYITENPTIGLAAHTTKRRNRTLTDAELVKVWKAAEQTEGHFGTIVRLLITTGQRRGEIAGLKASYYSNTQQTLCLPSEITKNGRQHTFPIGTVSSSLLSSASGSSLSPQSFIFPARGKSSSPFNGWSKSKKALDKLAPIDPWTLHDLRRTYRSNLGRLGVAPHIAERMVNHISSQTDMEQTYDIWTYLPEMRAAQTLYENWLSGLLNLS